ncbi:hypothetical protein LXL04_008794 [Taraxacum kok-saghyz]
MYDAGLAFNAMKYDSLGLGFEAVARHSVGEALFKLFDMIIQKTEPQDVVQIITDNTANNVLGGQLVEKKHGTKAGSRASQNNVDTAIKVGYPLLGVLRMVDGERKTPIGYIYEAMNRAYKSIASSFNNNKEKLLLTEENELQILK